MTMLLLTMQLLTMQHLPMRLVTMQLRYRSYDAATMLDDTGPSTIHRLGTRRYRIRRARSVMRIRRASSVMDCAVTGTYTVAEDVNDLFDESMCESI